MNRPIVEQNHQVPVYLLQQMAEKYRHFLALNITLIELAAQGTMEAFRADGNPRDRGDPLMTIPVVEEE